MKDLQAITMVATVPEMLVVASNVPAKNMDELVALAKAQPGKLNFASAGVGGLPHLAGELFKLTAKIDIVHVPYRGAAPAINDLLGQQVQMTFLDLPVILPHIKAGRLRGKTHRRRGREGKARRSRPHHCRRHIRAFPRIYRRRNQEMGESDQGRRRRDDEVTESDARFISVICPGMTNLILLPLTPLTRADTPP